MQTWLTPEFVTVGIEINENISIQLIIFRNKLNLGVKGIRVKFLRIRSRFLKSNNLQNFVLQKVIEDFETFILP